MTHQGQREIIVRPRGKEELVAPIQKEAGDVEDESGVEEDVVVQEDDGEIGEKVVDTDTRPV